MANLNADYVSTGKPNLGGAIFVAPTGSTLPTDATTELDSAFKSLGFVSADGLTNNRSFNSTEIKEWGGSTVLTMEGEKTDNFGFELIEILNVDVLKEVYGESNVTGTLETGITVKATAEQRPNRSWVIDMVMRNNVLKRIVIPVGSISELAEMSYKSDEVSGYGVTITAMADSASVTHYEYIKKPNT